MRLTLAFEHIGSEDLYYYTDYVESVNVISSLDNILQSSMPVFQLRVILSTRLDESFKTGDFVLWGIENSHRLSSMKMKKITRAKHRTEIIAWPADPYLSEGFVNGGLFKLTTGFANIGTNFSLKMDSALLNKGTNIYVQTWQDLLLGVLNTANSPSILTANTLEPWLIDGRYASGGFRIIRQLQTLAEFDASPAPNQAKYEIDYNDVVDEAEVTHTVDTTSIETSQLQEKKLAAEFEYSSSGVWSNAFNEVRLHSSSDGVYGVGITTGSGTSMTTELHMSDGGVYSVNGAVIGVSSNWYARSYQSGSSYYVELLDFEGNSLAVIQTPVLVGADSPMITSEIATFSQVKTFLSAEQAYTRLFFAKVASSSGSYIFGLDIRLNSSNQYVLTLLATTSLTADAWFCLSDNANSAGYAADRYYYGISITQLNAISVNAYPRKSSDTTQVYPMPLGAGYRPSVTPHYVKRVYDSTPAIINEWQWSTALTGDTYDYVWDKLARKGSHLAYRSGINELATTDITMRGTYLKVISTGARTLLLFSNGSNDPVRKVVVDSVLPENTYERTSVVTTTDKTGEPYQQQLPFLLQPNVKVLPLLPTDKTRVKVQVSAFKTTVTRSSYIKMNAQSISRASGSIYFRFNNKPQPGHKYYLSVDVKAPTGMTSDYASVGWPVASQTLHSPIAMISLTSIAATGDNWQKKSGIATIPLDYVPAASSFGVHCENADTDWYFTKPQLFDLTDAFGAGNEPTKEWCDENLVLTDNMLANFTLISTSAYAWYFSNASYVVQPTTQRHKVDNNSFELPQVGCPVLYHRDDPSVSPGEEGLILGFEHDFDGGSKLYIDILLLGSPDPWKS